MAQSPQGFNNGTQSFINFDDGGGTVLTQIVTVGTIQSGTITTIPNIPGGTLGLVTRIGNVGTLEVGTISTLPNIPGGTITRVSTIGTLEFGTISSLPNLPQGSINVTAGTVTAGSIRVVAGTVGGAAATAVALSGNPIPVGGVDSGGTVYGFLVDAKGQQILGGGTIDMFKAGTISTLPNIPGGSIVVTTGTIAAHAITAATITEGTLRNLISGTINSATVVLNTGTISVLPNLPQGSINVTAGTVNAGTINAATITAGTVSVAIGTINHGTIDNGTVRIDARTTQNIVTFGTQFAATAAAVSTIVGSASVGAGTSLWVNDFSLINPYGTVLAVVSFGTTQQGTNVLFRGVLGTQTAPGIEKSYPKMTNAGMTNQDLVVSLGAAGTVDLSVSYIISA